ncbi:MAG: extracellular solute-binding protein, partial [Legionellales bacterium]|nr:extracellular solute-binding protein [Legionellales bacterium]
QLLHEQQKTAADVVFFQESGYLGLLAQAGMLAPIDSRITAPIPAHFKDPNHYWVGASARMRVLVYNPEKVTADQLPISLEQLTDPKWRGRLGWAPTNASFQAHISALRHLWGEEKTQQWLRDIIANQPVNYPRNSQIVQAVGQGEVDLGWSNHYYMHQLKKQNPNLPVMNYHFPEEGNAGNLLIVSGVGILAHSDKQALAEQWVAFLLSEYAQTYFAQSASEYPTHPDITPATALTPVADIKHLEIDSSNLVDLSPTVALLQTLGIL